MGDGNGTEAEVRIPSDCAAAGPVRQQIIERMRQLECSSQELFCVNLALEEALVNAIVHGNGRDSKKTVRVFSEIRDDRIQIVIEDQGDGFCPEAVPDPTAEENLTKAHGRGIMLMRRFMDRVEFHGCGNRVLLEKQLQRGNGAAPEITG